METERVEPNERDLEALNNYQDSRKRPRSGCNSPSTSECLLDSPQIKKEKVDEPPWRPADSVWLEDPKGLYGMKPEYLRILGIEPPITKWICVENFRCDKTELREVLELAGYVVVCSVIHGHQKHAKVMYSHALEALQAVSMFNKQVFYGRAISVTMMRFPINSVVLPKGLPNIGPGFGTYGKPLKDIVKHFERFVKKEPHSVNTYLFYDPNDTERPASVETIDSEKSKEDINEKFQFKQFIIRNVEDDNNDSKSETDSKNGSITGNSSEAGSKTPLPKYSPRSPTHSPALTDDNTIVSMSVSPDSGLKKSQNPTPLNNTAPRAIIKVNTSNSAINSSGPIMGPVPAANNLLSTPAVLQGAMMGPNPMSASVGPRFGPNIPLTGPMNGPRFGPNLGPLAGPNIIAGSNNMAGPNSMAGPNIMPGPVGPRFGPTPVPPISRPSGPVLRPNAPILGPNMAALNGPRLRPTAPMVGPLAGSNGPGMRPNAGPNSTGLLSMPPTTVQFRNLPPTTSFQILCEKMSVCGQVLSLQLTTPGCATVVFSHPTHAQRCFQRYNNLMVDGCLIEARVI